MLLSLICADECGVVWPYLLDGADVAALIAAMPGNLDSLRAEFAVVIEERRRRAAAAALVLAADVDA